MKLPKLESETFETQLEMQKKDRAKTMKDLKVLVKRCVAEQNNHKKLMKDINHAQLVQAILNKEERRTWKQMYHNQLTKPRVMKDLFRDLHT